MKRLRVLSIPGRSYIGNPYWTYFCEGFDQVGVPVVDVRTADALMQRFDVVHIHLPDHQVAEVSLPKALVLAPVFLAILTAARLRGCPVVWTVHDVSPFKRRHDWLLKPYMRAVMRLVTGYVFMNASSRIEFFGRYPGEARKPALLVPHGPYPVQPVSEERRLALRRSAGGEGAFLVGMLGDIKPYKNIAAIAEVPRVDAEGRPIRIVVAGALDPQQEAGVVEGAIAAAGPDRVHRLDRRLSDRDLAEWIAAVDLVLLPYRQGSNSGFAMLVLSAGGRILASDLPMFRDLEEAIGRPWVYTAGTEPGALAAAVLAAAGDFVTEGGRRTLSETLDQQGFDAGALRLEAFYRKLSGEVVS